MFHTSLRLMQYYFVFVLYCCLMDRCRWQLTWICLMAEGHLENLFITFSRHAAPNENSLSLPIAHLYPTTLPSPLSPLYPSKPNLPHPLLTQLWPLQTFTTPPRKSTLPYPYSIFPLLSSPLTTSKIIPYVDRMCETSLVAVSHTHEREYMRIGWILLICIHSKYCKKNSPIS